MAQLTIGNAYSTTSEQCTPFAIFYYREEVRAQAYQSIETKIAFGQVGKAELTYRAPLNLAMRALMLIGGTPVRAPAPG